MSERLMYVTDWFSTLLHLAGQEENIPDDVDSFNMWDSISSGAKSPRTEIILNLDQDNYRGTWSGAIRSDRWKLIWGQDYLLKQDKHERSCDVQLFNIKKDPNETKNEAWAGKSSIGKIKRKVQELKDRLMEEFKTMSWADYPREERKGWPGNSEGNFATGWCDIRN